MKAVTRSMVMVLALLGAQTACEANDDGPASGDPGVPGPADGSTKDPGAVADAVRVTTLSTMVADWPWLTDAPQGEWGYSALIEIGDRKVLFDTGRDAQLVERNLEALGLTLDDVDDVILSHHHGDHTGGLGRLKEKFPDALDQVWVARGFFDKDPDSTETDDSGAIAKPSARQRYVAAGGVDTAFHEVAEPTSLFGLEYVRLTGPIAREYEEKDVAAGELSVPDDQALVIDTAKGLVVVTGCGHAGVINTVRAAQRVFPDRPVHAVVGGLHLYEYTSSYGVAENLEGYLAAVGRQLRGERVDADLPALGKPTPVDYLVGSHCTGLDPLFHLREHAADGRAERAVVDSVATRFVVGASFFNEAARRVPWFHSDAAQDSLTDGINPVFMNRGITIAPPALE